MSEGEIDGFDIDLQLDQVANAFVIAGTRGLDRRRPDLGLEVLADRVKSGSDCRVVSGHGVLFQVGDRLAGLFLFQQGGVSGVGR